MGLSFISPESFVKSPTNAVGPLGVMWSLAIEEQFLSGMALVCAILFWPAIARDCSFRYLSVASTKAGIGCV